MSDDVFENVTRMLHRLQRTVICHPDQHEALTAGVEADPLMRARVTVIASDLVPAGTAYVMPAHPELMEAPVIRPEPDDERWFEAEHWAGFPTMPDAERPVDVDDEDEERPR